MSGERPRPTHPSKWFASIILKDGKLLELPRCILAPKGFRPVRPTPSCNVPSVSEEQFIKHHVCVQSLECIVIFHCPGIHFNCRAPLLHTEGRTWGGLPRQAPRRAVCRYWLAGHCRFGGQCWNHHVVSWRQREEQSIKHHWFQHPERPRTEAHTTGGWDSPSICVFYQEGRCIFGRRCWYLHLVSWH